MEFFASWVFKCRRWVYLKMKFPRLEKPPDIVRKGVLAEKKVEKFFELMGVDYVKQPRGRIDFENFSILGRADFLTKGCVVEVKHSSRNFPKDWVAQLNLYMKMFGVDKGVLVRLSGDSISMKLFEFDEVLYRDSVEYFEWFLENRPNPPEKCYNTWCGFKHICKFVG